MPITIIQRATRVLLAISVAVCTALVALHACAAEVPALTRRVIDQTGTLSPSQQESLEGKLKALEDAKGAQIAVLLIPSTSPDTIEQYAAKVFAAWKIGRKKIDDGALLIVAKSDHRVRIEVGYGLESALSNVVTQRIINETIAPPFKSDDYYKGISNGIESMIAVVSEQPLPAVSPPESYLARVMKSSLLNGGILLFIAAAFAILGFGWLILIKFLGRVLGSIVLGTLTALALYYADAGTGVALWGGFIVLSISTIAAIYGIGEPSLRGTNSNASRDISSSDGFIGGGGRSGGGGSSGSW